MSFIRQGQTRFPRFMQIFSNRGVTQPAQQRRLRCIADQVEEHGASTVPETAASPLVWSRLIEVHDLCFEDPIELLLLEDQEVIQAFSPDAQEKTFTDGIREGVSGTVFEAP